MRSVFIVCTVLTLTLIASPAFAQSTTDEGEVIDHSELSALLSQFVDDEGQVDYRAWSEDSEALKALDTYVDRIGEASVDRHSRDAKLAFYLNAYNALVLDSILERWPVANPRDIDGFFDDIEHNVAGESKTLDALEHRLIRTEFDEPRIHFVLVCAAKSCPRLRREALTAQNLETTLAAAASEFISEVTVVKSEGEGDESSSVVLTSKLFDWFSKDFVESAGSVRAYLLEYVEGDVKAALENEADIEFRSYDWTINAQSK